MERKALTCSQCGAPASADRCEYCGAVFSETAEVTDVLKAPPITRSALTVSECPDRMLLLIRKASLELERNGVERFRIGLARAYICRLSDEVVYQIQGEEIFQRIAVEPSHKVGRPIEDQIGMFLGIVFVRDGSLPDGSAVIYGK